MRDIRKIIQLRALLVFIGILGIIWSILCVSSIQTCTGIKHPKEVTGKDSPFLKSGNVVSIEYEYFFDGRFVSGFVFGKDYYYEMIKLSDKEEFLYCLFIGEHESFLADKPFYRLYREIQELNPEDKNLFLGKVRKSKYNKEVFIEKATTSKEGIYKNPSTLTNTNFEYYIQYIIPEEETNRMFGRFTFLGLLVVIWLFLLKRIQQEKNAYLFYLNEKRINQRIENQMKIVKQMKELANEEKTSILRINPQEIEDTYEVVRKNDK